MKLNDLKLIVGTTDGDIYICFELPDGLRFGSLLELDEAENFVEAVRQKIEQAKKGVSEPVYLSSDIKANYE